MTDSEGLPRETLDFIFEQVRDAPSEQLQAVDALDAKMVQVFGAAAVTLGLAAAGTAGHGTTRGVFIIVAVVAFGVVACAAIYSLWVRRFGVSIAADQLWRRYWRDEVGNIKHAIVADVADAYSKNAALLAHKRVALRWALIALAVEAAAIGASIIASVL
jgi:hypothetical protein